MNTELLTWLVLGLFGLKVVGLICLLWSLYRLHKETHEALARRNLL